MPVTLREIAAKTGLALPTVGNVLGRSGGRYSPETRERVLRVAEELGYRPNTSARAMRHGRFDCVALVLSRSRTSTHSHLVPGLLDGLDDALAQHDKHLTVSRLTDEELSADDVLPKVLRSHMADGMIVNYTHDIPPRMLELIRAQSTPAVWLNAKLPSDCVYPDEIAGATAATRQLIELGHRRIAMVRFTSSHMAGAPFESLRARGLHYSLVDRTAGYVQAMRAAGLSPRVAMEDRFVSEEDQLPVCRALLSGPDRPTAVLAYSDGEVGSLLCAAREAGLSVPRDLSVLMFYPWSSWHCGVLVTGVLLPTLEVGRRAVAMLMGKIENATGPRPPEAVAYGPEPYGGGPYTSVAPPPPPLSQIGGETGRLVPAAADAAVVQSVMQ